jgi:ParB family chromosome partitioning protein
MHGNVSRSDLIRGLIEDIDVSRIKPPRVPLRSQLTDIEQLAWSIKENGLLQPIVVRPDNVETFEIVAGNRRYTACQSLGWRKIPCHIAELDDREAFEISLIENIQRKTLNPIEEAESFKNYVSELGWGGVSDLARKIGKSQEYVSKRMKLLELPKEIQHEIIRRRIKTSVAEELAYVKDKEEQSRLAQLIAARRTTIKKLRNMAKHSSGSKFEDYPVFQARDDEKYLASLDKTIIAFKYALAKLARIIDNVEDNWTVHEILMQHKNALHSQIDLLLKQKKKFVELSEIQPQLLK